jgi:DNA-binding NarL/FixJ family response regulator
MLGANAGDRGDAPTVVLIEDHVLFRAGLRDLLARAGIRVLGEADAVEPGLELVLRLSPDVAIVDLHLPGAPGREAIRRIRELAPATRSLALTVSDDETDVVGAVLAGARGYVLKDAAPGDIVLAVRTTAGGGSMLSPSVATTLIEALRRSRRGAAPSNDSGLSAREREVLRLVVDGKTNAAIAQELVISPYTVRRHLSNILLKLHVETRLQAAVRAVRDSLI